MLEVIVRDIMDRSFITVDHTTPDDTVVAELAERQIPCAVVTSDGVPIKVVRRLGSGETRIISEILTIAEDKTLAQAAAEMVDHGCELMVVKGEGGRIVGVLSTFGIISGYLMSSEKERLSVESAAIYLVMTRSREYEQYWLARLAKMGYRAAITQVGTGAEKLALKLRESMIAAAVARAVIRDDAREKIAVSNAVRDAYMQLATNNPGLGGGFKLAAVRGEGRVSVAVFGRFGHAFADGPEQLAVGFSII